MVRRGRDIASRVSLGGGRGLRRRLLAGCALASAALAPALAHAQLVYDPTATLVGGGIGPTIAQTPHSTDVSLAAQRTILNWSTYNLTSDQTVIYRFQDASGIVLNRVAGPATIDGQVEALVGSQRGAGNVWFASSSGVVFGPNARVNVGGLLATTATVSQAALLDPSTSSIGFTGAESGQVLVRAGAQLKADGGGMALIAGSVATQDGSVLTANSTILIGAANDFTVRFGTQPGDLDLLDFVVPAGGGTGSTTPLTLAGQAAGADVILAAVNRADVASAVINASGLIAAQSATTDHGDVVLSAGASIVSRQPGNVRVNATTTTTATFGVVSAQRDLLGAFAQPTTFSGGQVSAGRDLGISVASLDVGALNAGRSMAVDAATSITLRGGAAAGSAALFRTNGALIAGTSGAGAISAVGRLQVDAGTLKVGQLNAGRSVVVTASGADVAAAGTTAATPAVGVTSVVAGDDISMTTTNASGSIVLGGAQITGSGVDEAPAGRTVTLTARGANGDVTYGAATGTALNGATKVTVSAGHDATLNVLGLLTLGSGTAGHNLTVRATDLDITGPVSAGTFRVESLGGPLTLGGATGSSIAGGAAAGTEGLRITDAEFQRITVTGEAQFYAGSPGGSARGDLTVLDLSVDTTKLPGLLLAAGPNNDIAIVGVLAPLSSGGTLSIGDKSTTSGFQSGRILLSGSIGASTGSPTAGFTGVRAFNEVALNAQRDIILGSQRFIALVNGLTADQIDVANNKPLGVAAQGDEIGHVFLTAGVLALAAPAKIVQENTGTRAAGNGFYLTNLVAAPRETVLTVTSAQVVDLFGSLRDKAGVLRSGSQASRLIQIVSFDGSSGFDGDLRFNGFDTGPLGLGGASGGSASSPVEVAAQSTSQVASVISAASEDSGGLGDDSSSDSGGGTAVGPAPEPVLITIAKPGLDEIISDPIELGTGNDESWRGKKPR